jgi:LPXTG-motif cell wall-anchored protein
VDNRTDGKLNGPQKDASKTRTITFPEDSGTHTVKYVMDAGSEKDLYKDKAVGEWTVLTIETDCAPPPIRPTCTTVEGSVTLTAPEYVGDVLTLVTTDDEQGSWLIPFEGTLADIGTVLEVDADPSQFVGLWIYVDGMGWIVYEEGYYGGDLWSNTTFPGIDPKHGYAAGAPIGDYIALYGDLGAEAWLLYGSSEPGSTAVTSVTVGCTTYTFDFEEAIIVPEEPVVPASSGLPATGGDVTLPLGLAGILLALGGAVAIGRRVFR